MYIIITIKHLYVFVKYVYRYLKSIFPKVDETILLDILEQSDNNVQKASEKLIDLGYEKRNTTFPVKTVAKKKEEEQVINFMLYKIYISRCFSDKEK